MFTENLLVSGVQTNEIGIITPYQLQSKKIRENLDELLYPNASPKIGSVEEFQGQERMIILISTVRSVKRDALQNDVKYNAGFVKSARRFNVAISRAR